MTTGKSIYEPVNPHMTREQGLEALHKSLATLFNEKVGVIAEAFPLDRYDDAQEYLIRAKDRFNKSSGMVAPLIGMAGSMPVSLGLCAMGGGDAALVCGLVAEAGFLMWGAARAIINTNGEKDVRSKFENDVRQKIHIRSKLTP
ncbi:MAG: hypothetical protein JWO78_2398 [Micavibrio sp.]|nr:hypothetical protein [Micavibrio sp.]